MLITLKNVFNAYIKFIRKCYDDFGDDDYIWTRDAFRSKNT